MLLKEISQSSKFDEIFVTSADAIPGDLPEDYLNLIKETNGGLTEDKVFHFFGIKGYLRHNVIEWNKAGLWKKHYDLDEQSFIFAQDLFGDQYFFKRGNRGNAIYFLNPSNGQTYFTADTFADFIEDVVDDSEEMLVEKLAIARNFFNKYSLDWEPFKHLSYKHPPILNGSEEDPDNIELCDSLANLSFTGQLIEQLKNVPEGTVVKDVQIDKEANSVTLIY